jgi:hypothetical protein
MLHEYLEGGVRSGAMEINVVLEDLSDKKWHQLDELTSETHIDKEHVLKIVNFFREFGFIEISASGEHVKLDKDYVDL